MTSILQLRIQLPVSKVCPSCKQLLPSDQFDPDLTNKSGLQWACRDCAKTYRRALAQRPEYKERARARYIQRKYGLTMDDFDARFAAQGKVCAICGIDDHMSKNWHVDHDHDTGVVRGILCNGCNTGLGGMRDNPATLRAAADYLEKYGK